MNLSKIKDISIILLCLTLSATSLRLYFLLDGASPRLNYALEQTGKTVANVNDTTAEIKEYVVEQKAQLEDSRKSIKAALEIGATGKASLQLLNRFTIPTATRAFDELGQVAKTAEEQLRANGELLADNQRRLGKSLDNIETITGNELRQAVGEFALAGKNLRVITDDPALTSLPSEVRKIAESLNRSAGSVEVILTDTEKTAKNVAGTTGNIEKSTAEINTFLHGKLNSPSPWYRKYLLTPLREVGGITYLLVKIGNGL